MSIETKVWKCEKCSSHYHDVTAADDCCKEKPHEVIRKCRVCECEVKEHRVICDICLEQERYAKAKKVKYSEYKIGYLWDETKDKYFSNKTELEDKYDDDADDNGTNVEYPIWCYGCTETTFSIDIDSAIENALEDMYEDFSDIEDEKGLQDFVKEWNAKQTGKTYDLDYRTVVLLNE